MNIFRALHTNKLSLEFCTTRVRRYAGIALGTACRLAAAGGGVTRITTAVGGIETFTALTLGRIVVRRLTAALSIIWNALVIFTLGCIAAAVRVI